MPTDFAASTDASASPRNGSPVRRASGKLSRLSTAARTRASLDTVAWIALLSGLLLPVYLLDDSVALKSVLSPVIGLACFAWLFASRFDGRAAGGALCLALLCFAGSYALSLAASALGMGLTLNAAYPLLFVGLCLRAPTGIGPFVRGLFVSLLAITVFGWVRFISGEGGAPGEHALGYWGIKYTEATRNNDALAPILVSALALAAFQRLHEGSARAWRLLVWFALLIGIPALALTFARSAWIAVVCFVVLQSGSNWRVFVRLALSLAVAGTVLMAVAAMIIPDFFEQAVDLAALLERLQSIYDPSISSSNADRSRLLTYGVLLGLNHPLFGVGAGQFECCFAEFGFSDLLGALHPENLILHLFSEFGIVPAFSALAVIAIAIARGLRSRAPNRHSAGALLTALMLFLQMNSELPSLFVWVLLGVTAGVASHATRRA